ncbi:polysaccharide deacetylase family protein [Desulfotomaculum copahuensis]|uniref:Polysaccharide deacetylase n=1 Tax=Desulfotomaculum copahuensis TaxID=1838280 RepID=A0A1B7LC44_9FIRM|nr:polysaccharide deacetylase family protein [Desulfotomaculum copahuensis]OAT80220.1 polysaccharide deacetylase [Desulfotomaculum copahuensis]
MFRLTVIAAASICFLSLAVFLGVRNAENSLAEALLPVVPAAIEHSNQVPILMFHKVNPDPRVGGLGLRVPPDKFDREMAYLHQNGFHTVSLTDVVEHYRTGKPLPARPVVITFDDGYRDNFTYAFPILKKYHFTATIFVVADTVGGINSFDVRAHLQPVNRMASWAELGQMAAAGITIGSHTLDHPHLAQIPPAEAWRQIRQSRMVLEKHLGRPVRVFSYPYGSFNSRVAQMVRDSGYLAAVTTVQGIAGPGSDPWLLKRVRIMGSYDLDKFAGELLRYYRVVHSPAHPAGGRAA